MDSHTRPQTRLCGKVVDITSGNIYLEIERQVRFKAEYEPTQGSEQVGRNDVVEFHFFVERGHPRVRIDSILNRR